MDEPKKYTPTKGDYVEVTIEGRVGGVGTTNFNLFSEDGGTYNVIALKAGAKIKKIAPPEVEPAKGQYFYLISTGGTARTGYRYLSGNYLLSPPFAGSNRDEQELHSWAEIRKLYPRQHTPGKMSGWTLSVAEKPDRS